MSHWFLVERKNSAATDGRWSPTSTARAGKWTVDEDKNLKDRVREHGGKNRNAIAALAPGRTRKQCRIRWHDTLVSNVGPTTARASKWTADEGKKLKDEVREHVARIGRQLPRLSQVERKLSVERDGIASKGDPTTALAGKLTAYKDKKLKSARWQEVGGNYRADFWWK